VALIAGPTASGKTAVAVELALALEKQGRKSAIINADSAQVYSDLHVLSARPTQDEMCGIEHRLFGAWDGSQACSAPEWAGRATGEIAALHAQDAVPILCGGTGMYMKTLLEGIAPIPEITPSIRETVRRLPTRDAYSALGEEDPKRHAMLAPNDSQRIARALEVVRSTGKTMGYWQKRKSGGIADSIDLHPLLLLPDRKWLYERCDRRFILMLEQGALAEVEQLVARKLDPELPVMRAIGVREIASYLRALCSRDEMVEQGQQATRNYAKRQFTWFRRQTGEDWPKAESQNYDISVNFASLLLN
jgi:tRNA dimethylallyltransferase